MSIANPGSHVDVEAAWPRSSSDDPYYGPYKILFVDGHRITMRCSPRLGGPWCALLNSSGATTTQRTSVGNNGN